MQMSGLLYCTGKFINEEKLSLTGGLSNLTLKRQKLYRAVHV